MRRDVGYQVIGGTKFYERAEVKDAIAYLTVLGNPQDVVSFTRDRQLAAARASARRRSSRVIAHADDDGHLRLGGRGDDPASVPGLGTAAVRAFERFMDTMAELRGAAGAGRRRSATCSRRSCTRRATSTALEAERTIEAQGRIGEPRRSSSRSRASSTPPPRRESDTLDVFLQQIALVADADTRRDDEGLVTLMTLHNAKGLEYPIVFIIGCEEGVFPHSRSIDEGTLEEERRLMYVGITRAMRDLYLTHAAAARSSAARRTTGCRAASWPSCRPTCVDRRGAGAATWGGSASLAGAPGARPRDVVGRAAGGWAAAAPTPPARASGTGDDVVARRVRRRRGHRRRAGRHRRGPLRRRRLRAQADGRVRADHEALRPR